MTEDLPVRLANGVTTHKRWPAGRLLHPVLDVEASSRVRIAPGVGLDRSLAKPVKLR
jgi:hypothetical protein